MEERKILQKIGELNIEQGTSAFSKFGCKNEGFVTAMVCKGAELHRDAFKLTDKGACFADGSTFECDAVVACTGYRNSFPMFDHIDVREDVICSKCGCRTKDLNAFGQNPRRLYKQIFVPVFPDGQVAFFGFARPAFGSVLSSCRIPLSSSDCSPPSRESTTESFSTGDVNATYNEYQGGNATLDIDGIGASCTGDWAVEHWCARRRRRPMP